MVTVAALMLTFLLLAFGADQFGPVGTALPIFMFAIIILWSRPRMLLALYWMTLLFIPTLEIVWPSPLVKYIEQGFALCLFAVLVGDLIITSETVSNTRSVARAMFFLLALAGVATIVNKVPAKPVAFYLLTYMKHFILFFFAVRYLRPQDSRFMFRLMMLSFAIQLMFNLAYYLGVNPLPRIIWRGFADASIGTVGSCNIVGYLMLATIFILIAYARNLPGLRAKWLGFVGSTVAFAQLVLTYTMHAYPLLALALGVQYALFGRRSLFRVLRGVAAVSLVVGVVAAAILNGPAGRTAHLGFRPWVWQYQWDRMLHGPKIEAYREVILHGSRHLRYPLLGAGPGNYTSNIAFITGRPLALLPHMFYRYEAIERQNVSMGGSILTMTRTGLLSLWGELGPFGALVFWGIYVVAGIHVARLRRRGEYRDPYRKVLAEGFVPAIFVVFILNFLNESVAIPQLNIGLWIWAGAVWTPCPTDTPESANAPQS
jgi:hypothetical protein